MKKAVIILVAAMMMASCGGGSRGGNDPKQVAIDYAYAIFPSNFKTMKRLSTEKNLTHVLRIEEALKNLHSDKSTKTLKVEATRVVDGKSDDVKYVFVTIEYIIFDMQKVVAKYEMKIVKVDGKWYVDGYENI